MKLLIDLGNSYLKWVYLGETQNLPPVNQLPHSQLDLLLEQSFSELDAVWITSVVQRSTAEDVAGKIQRRWGIEPQFVAAQKRWHELELAYKDIDQFGVDRFLAMVALTPAESNYILVSVGTAITVDWVSEYQHQGGLILPGLESLASYFSQKFPHLAFIPDYNRGVELANNTSDAINRGMIRSTVSTVLSILEEAKLTRVICTGGQGEVVTRYLNQIGKNLSVDNKPYLVLEGLNKVVP